MGLDLQVTRFLLSAVAEGVDVSTVLTLGRQNLSVHPTDLEQEARRFGLSGVLDALPQIYAAYPYSEPLLRALGARTVDSCDASAYEGATHVLDLNQPLPESWTRRYTCVLDGGTMEHIFDFPQVVRNVARLLEVGGRFIAVEGANNFVGHGFYQFSPELFWRVFSPQNGFSVDRLLLTEVHRDADWVHVADPAVVRSRVQVTNTQPTYLMMVATKTAEVDLFVEPPQQSDYEQTAWLATDQASVHTPVDVGALRRTGLSAALLRLPLRAARQRTRSLLTAARDPYRSPHLRRQRWSSLG